MGTLLTKLVPFRDYIYVAAVLALLSSLLYVRAQLINQGELRERTANQRIGELQRQHSQDVSDLAASKTSKNGDAYVAAINAPAPDGPPIVCLHTIPDGPGPMSASAGNSGVPAGAASQPRADQYDIGPPLRTVGRDDDALIAALQNQVVILRDAMKGATP